MQWPKISLVTPNYNGGKYLEETIQSILSQGYPNLEYIIIDGGSTDNSLDIIKKYKSSLHYWISEPDLGMYYALQKGFYQSTGEIMAWLNADDLHHPKALFAVAEIFSEFQSVNWLMGYPTAIDGLGRASVPSRNPRLWYTHRYAFGDIGTIQQESVFWRRSIWEKSGSHISTSYKFAGDMELWSRFFQYEKLFNTNSLLAGFRRTNSNDQLSVKFSSNYKDEAREIIKNHKMEKKDKRFFIFKLLINSAVRFLNKYGFFNAAKIEVLLFGNVFDIPNLVIFDEMEGKFKFSKY